MSHDHNKQMRNVHAFDWSNGATIDQAKDMISYLVNKLQQAMSNPLLHAEVQGQMQVLNSSQLERSLVTPLGEGSKEGSPLRLEEEGEEQVNPLPQGHAHHNDSTKKSEENDTSSSLDSDVAPKRKRVKRSPNPPKRKSSSFHSPQKKKWQLRQEEEEEETITLSLSFIFIIIIIH